MVNKTTILLICKILFFTAIKINGQERESKQNILDEYIKTLEIQNSNQNRIRNIIDLNANETLTISFDDLSDEYRDLRYDIIHCTADWKPSDLIETEYLNGFNEAKINDYEYSRATLSHYIHYTLTIPGELKPLLPGNYILTVEEDRYPFKQLLKIKFSICENSVSISGDIDGRTDIDYMQEHQQLSIVIDAKNSDIDNLYTDVILTIEQNDRPETLKILKKPSRVMGRKAYYEHFPELIYEAGNEYRRLEIIQTNYPGMGVDNIRMTDGGYLATLITDYPKANAPYVYDSTQHGEYIIREYNSDRSDTESEYIDVLFSLDMPFMKDKEIYIEGDLTGRRFDDNSKMEYDDLTGKYHKILRLKQGAYNYQYIALTKDKDSNIPLNDIDGNKFQTTNEYTVKVYYRKRGERYDRLGGVAKIKFK